MLSSIFIDEVISGFILFRTVFYTQMFAYLKNIRTFAPAIGNHHRGNKKTGYSGT